MTILNRTEILVANTPLAIVSGIAAIVLFVMIFVSSVKLQSDGAAYICIGLFTIAFCFFLGIAAEIIFPVQTNRYAYECTIEDDVSFSEIAEKYNVVEQRGEIWVLNDKDDK